MSCVDLSDQYMAFHMSLHKSMKWWRKIFFHLLNMILLNSYILNKKFGTQKLTHEEYMEYIANYLLNEGLQGSTCAPQRTIRNNTDKLRLTEKHFISKIPKDNTREMDLNPICKACNFTQQMVKLGFGPYQLPRKMTTYWCNVNDYLSVMKTLCI